MKRLILLSVLFIITGGLIARQNSRLDSDRKMKNKEITLEDGSLNSIILNYCGDTEYNVGVDSNTFVKTAIQFPEEVMKKYTGNKLTKIVASIGKSSVMSECRVYLSYTLDGDPFYTQDVIFTESQANEIVLNTPYQIEGKELFLGYQMQIGKSSKKMAPVVCDTRIANEFSNYFALGKTGKSFTWKRLIDIGVIFNLKISAIIEGNTLPRYDIALDYLTTDKNIVRKGEKVNITGSLKNLGMETIRSFDVVYQTGDNNPVTLPIQNVNVPNEKRIDFQLKDILINSENITPVKVTITSLNNGNEPIANGKNKAALNILCVGEKSVPRKVLLENFTTAQCSNCPARHLLLEEAVGNNENVIWATQHSGYYTDELTIPENLAYTWFYNQKSTYAPAVMFDRTDLRAYGAVSDDNVDSPIMQYLDQSALQKPLEAALKMPAYVTLNIEKTLDDATNDLTITIHGNAVYGVLPAIPRMNVYLTESGINTYQAGYGENYENNHVIREVVSNLWGDPVTFDADGNYSVTYNFTLDNRWKSENMDIVAYLSNFDSRNVLNCQVYNAQSARINTSSGIETSGICNEMHVFSANSQIWIDGEFKNASIYDTTGKLIEILGPRQPSSSKVERGIYLVSLNYEKTNVVKIAVN